MKNYDNIPDRIVQYRAIKGISQGTFAAWCGLNRVYISEIETGKRVPGKIARAKIEYILKEME